MSMEPKPSEYGLFRAVFGPRIDEPIAELIAIIYSYFEWYFKSAENKNEASQLKKVPKRNDPHESDSDQETNENEEKGNESQLTAVESTKEEGSDQMVLESIAKDVVSPQNSPDSSKDTWKNLNSGSTFNSKQQQQSITSPTSPTLSSPYSIKDQILRNSFKERVDRKLKELSSTLVQPKFEKSSITSPKTSSITALDTRYAITKHVRYPDDTEVFQIVRYLKRYEPKTREYQQPGLKSFVQMPNGVIVPYECIGDHHR